jgi:PHD/YefM family antitoxin component YafN of YafNO toxin-antitoxin module
MGAEKKPDVERVYSTTEAKNQLSSIMHFIEGPGEAAIIESHGRPRAAVISYEEFEAFKKLKVKERRQQSLKRLEALRKEVSSRNQDLWHLSDDELMDFVVDALRDESQELHDIGRLDPKSTVPR